VESELAVVPYTEVLKGTGDLSADNVLGKGGFATVRI
jgi:hypothetical protein